MPNWPKSSWPSPIWVWTARSRNSRLINNFPWYIPAFDDPGVKDLADPFFSGQHLGEFYGQVAADVPAWYQSPFLPNAITALGDNLPNLFDGSMTPDQFVDKVVQITQDAIDFGF